MDDTFFVGVLRIEKDTGFFASLRMTQKKERRWHLAGNGRPHPTLEDSRRPLPLGEAMDRIEVAWRSGSRVEFAEKSVASNPGRGENWIIPPHFRYLLCSITGLADRSIRFAPEIKTVPP